MTAFHFDVIVEVFVLFEDAAVRFEHNRNFPDANIWDDSVIFVQLTISADFVLDVYIDHNAGGVGEVSSASFLWEHNFCGAIIFMNLWSEDGVIFEADFNFDGMVCGVRGRGGGGYG